MISPVPPGQRKVRNPSLASIYHATLRPSSKPTPTSPRSRPTADRTATSLQVRPLKPWILRETTGTPDPETVLGPAAITL